MADNIKEKEHNLKFQILMNIYYHEYLENKYNKLLNWAAFVSILFSSAAFFAIGDLIPSYFFITKNTIIIFFAFFISSYNAYILAFGVLDNLIKHRDLKKKWTDLRGNMLASETKLDINELQLLEKTFHNISSDEPPVNDKVLKKAFNLACRSMGLIDDNSKNNC